VQAANFLSLEQLFYGFIIPFIGFFFAFAFVIYPNTHVLHPTRASLSAMAPC
jgi:ATP:ADP antiporter, AAA family